MAERAHLRVAVAGVTGWAGAAVAAAVAAANDLELTAGVARGAAGQPLADLVPHAGPGSLVHRSVGEAFSAGKVDVVVDYTSAASVLANCNTAVDAGVHVVIGSSGLTADDYATLHEKATAAGVGVIAAGNFSLLASLLVRAAAQIASLVPDREIIDYGANSKMDAPSGTAREVAERMEPQSTAPPGGGSVGAIEARGAAIAGTQVHSLRLPGYALSTEVVFGLSGERLSLRHDAGDSPAPYVAGTLLAIRQVISVRGVVRGLDRWLDAPAG
jgi:4-hydroxy-tetrahydrodipicolinate reductase